MKLYSVNTILHLFAIFYIQILKITISLCEKLLVIKSVNFFIYTYFLIFE